MEIRAGIDLEKSGGIVIKISKLISRGVVIWNTLNRLDKLWVSKDYQSLVSYCNEVIARSPKYYFDPYYYRALAYEQLKQWDLAQEDFRITESLLNTYKRTGHIREYFTLIPIHQSRVYRKLQDKARAMEFADKAVQADSQRDDGLVWRSILKEQDFHDLIGASEDMNEALRRRPTDRVLRARRDGLTHDIVQVQRDKARR